MGNRKDSVRLYVSGRREDTNRVQGTFRERTPVSCPVPHRPRVLERTLGYIMPQPRLVYWSVHFSRYDGPPPPKSKYQRQPERLGHSDSSVSLHHTATAATTAGCRRIRVKSNVYAG